MTDVFRFCHGCDAPLFTAEEIHSYYDSSEVYCGACHADAIDNAANRLEMLCDAAWGEDGNTSDSGDAGSDDPDLFYERECHWCSNKGEYYTESAKLNRAGFPVFVLACETCALKPKYRPSYM